MTKPWATDAERAVLTYFLPENIVITNRSVQLAANSLFHCNFKVGFLHYSFYVEQYRINWSIWCKTGTAGKDGKGAFRAHKYSHTALDFIKNSFRFVHKTWSTVCDIPHLKKHIYGVFFIVALCIFKSAQFTHQQMHYLLTWLKVLNLH